MNDEELRELIKEVIKDSLTVSIDSDQDYYSNSLKVTIMMDNEIISSDSVTISSNS